MGPNFQHPTDRLPPQDLLAEQVALGSALCQPGADRRLLDAVDQEAFYFPRHQTIYAAIRSVRERGRPVELVTVVGELRDRGKLDEVGGIAYLDALIQEVPTAAHVAAYARRVRDKWQARQAVAFAEDLRERVNRDSGRPGEVLAQLQERWADLCKSPDGEVGLAITHEELTSGDFPPVRWIVEGLLAEQSVDVLSGESYVGKTWLSLSLALAVASGKPWLGHFEVCGGPVLVFAEEDGAAGLASRAQDLSRTQSDLPTNLPIHYRIGSGIQLDEAAGLQKVAEEVIAIAPALVVFDPLRACWSGDENDSRAVRDLVGNLRRLATQHGCAVLLLHHLRKKSQISNAPAERLRGSSDFRAAIDGHLALRQRDRDPSHLLLFHDKNRYGERTPSFGVDLINGEDGGLELLYVADASEDLADATKAQEHIVTLLQDGELSRGQLLKRSRAAGISERTFKRALSQLMESGMVARRTQGREAFFGLAEGGLLNA